MQRKILGICTALAALTALMVLPAIASASPELTHPTGTTATGKITAIAEQNTILTDTAGNPQVTCDSANDHTWLTGSIHQNTGKLIEATIEGAKFQGTTEREHSGKKLTTLCHSELLGPTQVLIPGLTNEGGTKHWCVKNTGIGDNFEVLPRSCTEATGGEFTFILTGALTCRYKRSANFSGTFTTTHPATLSLSGEPVFTREEPSSIFCPASGVFKNFKFNLYTDKATFAESTANPVAIS